MSDKKRVEKLEEIITLYSEHSSGLSSEIWHKIDNLKQSLTAIDSEENKNLAEFATDIKASNDLSNDNPIGVKQSQPCPVESSAEEILDEVKVFLLKIKTLTDSKLLYDQCDKLYNKLHFMEYAQSQKPSRDEIRSIIINAPCHFEEAEVERFTDYLFDELLKPVI
jgi:hypothetical protein